MTIYHKHHIIPKHMGGSDNPSNLVKVTAEEHAELHKQLWENLGYWQDCAAWQGLSKMMSRQDIIQYLMSGERHPHYGKTRPEEVKRKISQSRKGQSLQPWTEERRNKTISSLKNRKLSPEHIDKMKKARLGKSHSEETRQKMKDSQNKRRHLEKIML